MIGAEALVVTPGFEPSSPPVVLRPAGRAAQGHGAAGAARTAHHTVERAADGSATGRQFLQTDDPTCRSPCRQHHLSPRDGAAAFMMRELTGANTVRKTTRLPGQLYSRSPHLDGRLGDPI